MWTNGGAGSKIPESVKRTVRARQSHRCNTIDPSVCVRTIDEFDHIVNVKTQRVDRREANDPNGIQGLCRPCHKEKTQSEALAGRNRGKRKPLKHVGLGL